MADVLLLGPQRFAPTLPAELAARGWHGRVATITAGWQEREEDDFELREALAHRAENLRLHARCEAIFTQDPRLFEAHRARQDRLRRLQGLYRVRLDAHVATWRELNQSRDPLDLVEAELAHVILQLRDLDRHHLAQVAAIDAAFEDEVAPLERPAVRQQREEVGRVLEGCQVVALAGGHVAVLLNRLRLLGLAPILRRRPVVAWSAGAMALTERVVVFHDHPPQGPGSAEVLQRGLGIVPGVVALPHAQRRLRLHDRVRLALLARRFAPDACLLLVENDVVALDLATRAWTAGPPVQALGRDGAVVPASEVLA